jgi:hypothetical protein
VCSLYDFKREICKPVLKLDFTAHGIIESLSEFGLGTLTQALEPIAKLQSTNYLLHNSVSDLGTDHADELLVRIPPLLVHIVDSPWDLLEIAGGSMEEAG